jgi:hypothetical protein
MLLGGRVVTILAIELLMHTVSVEWFDGMNSLTAMKTRSVIMLSAPSVAPTNRIAVEQRALRIAHLPGGHDEDIIDTLHRLQQHHERSHQTQSLLFDGAGSQPLGSIADQWGRGRSRRSTHS